MKKLIIFAILLAICCSPQESFASRVVQKPAVSQVQTVNYFAEGLKYKNAKNYENAKINFEKAAKQGNVRAQYYLGYFYTNNLLQEKNQTLGVDWLTKSAEKGYAPAQSLLANYYIDGFCVNKNYSKAAYYAELAANQGNGSGLFNWAFLHQMGMDVESWNWDKLNPIFNKAYEQLKTEAQQGDPEAQYNLAYLYSREENFSTSFYWFKSSADNGFVPAFDGLGAYYGGSGGQENKDIAKAKFWLEKALKNGYGKSQDYLNTLYNK